MERFKQISKRLLFPHTAIALLLLVLSVPWLIYALIFLDSTSLVAVLSYALATYTLAIWCLKVPSLITWGRRVRDENRFARRWLDDVRLRMNISLYGSFLWNVAYAVFQLWLGLYHGSFWFYSMAAYYSFLAVMRLDLVRHTSRHNPGENMREELRKYRACGWFFLVMNLALSLMIFFMVYWGRTFHHHQITTIAMAAYTFTAFTVAIINLIRYRKYRSPVFSASKSISLAAACVSMITLTSTMLTTFGDGANDLLFRRLMLTLLGGAVSIFIITMAIYMIVRSNRELQTLQNNNSETSD